MSGAGDSTLFVWACGCEEIDGEMWQRWSVSNPTARLLGERRLFLLLRPDLDATAALACAAGIVAGLPAQPRHTSAAQTFGRAVRTGVRWVRWLADWHQLR